MSCANDIGRVLSRGNLPQNQETVSALALGLWTIGQSYRLIKLSITQPPIRKLLSSLQQIANLSSRQAKIFEEDTAAGGQLETLLFTRSNINALEFIKNLRELEESAEHFRAILEQDARVRQNASKLGSACDGAPPRHRAEPETWLYLALHDLYEALIRRKPGIAGPLHRFTEECAAIVDPQVHVPPREAFQSRLRAALKRRGTEKISVFPIRAYGKNLAVHNR
jgi:hypothetical protein